MSAFRHRLAIHQVPATLLCVLLLAMLAMFAVVDNYRAGEPQQQGSASHQRG